MRVKAVEIEPEVAAVLDSATWDEGLLLLPPGQLDRKLYERVDRVLRALGGRWDRRARAHVFGWDAKAAFREALAAGQAVDNKRTMEQFFTPDHVANGLAMALALSNTDHVLEPSAGDGALVRAVIGTAGIVTAVEKDGRLCDGPLFDLAAKPENHGRLDVYCADFMEWEPSGPPIDAVIMNPPFGQCADIAHVRRAFSMLRPGGRLVAIMSPHWRFASDVMSREFREFVDSAMGRWAGLPPGSFRESGTGVSTGVLTLARQ